MWLESAWPRCVTPTKSRCLSRRAMLRSGQEFEPLRAASGKAASNCDRPESLHSNSSAMHWDSGIMYGRRYLGPVKEALLLDLAIVFAIVLPDCVVEDTADALHPLGCPGLSGMPRWRQSSNRPGWYPSCMRSISLLNSSNVWYCTYSAEACSVA